MVVTLVHKQIHMHIVKVKRNGRTDIKETMKFHLAPRVPKHKRQTLKQIISQRKRAERDARLVQMF